MEFRRMQFRDGTAIAAERSGADRVTNSEGPARRESPGRQEAKIGF